MIIQYSTAKRYVLKTALVIGAIVLVSGAAYGSWKVFSKSKQAIIEEEPITDWKTYRNEEYEFRYPFNWRLFIEDNFDYNGIIIYSFQEKPHAEIHVTIGKIDGSFGDWKFLAHNIFLTGGTETDFKGELALKEVIEGPITPGGSYQYSESIIFPFPEKDKIVEISLSLVNPTESIKAFYIRTYRTILDSFCFLF